MAIAAPSTGSADAQPAHRALAVGIVLNAIGPLGVWCMPLLLAAVGHRLTLDNTAAGMLASAALGGACVMAFAQALLFRVLPPRALAMGCFAALLAAYLVVLSGPAFMPALAVMGMLGLGMGGLLVLSLGAAETSGQISRVSAAGLVSQAGISAAIAWAVSHYEGAQADRLLVTLLVMITTAGLLVLHWVPKHPSQTNRQPHDAAPRSRTLVVALVAWGFANFASGGFWPLTERIGTANGIGASAIGEAIAWSSLAGIAGGFAAMVLGRALALPLAIMVIGIGTAASVVGVVLGSSPASFALAMIGFGFLWNFGPPYQLPVISEADTAGNGMAWAILSMKVSMAAGPLAYGSLADRFGFASAGLLSMAASLISAALFAAALTMKRGERIHHTPSERNR